MARDPKAPKPPKLSASKQEHRKFAEEVLAYEPYKREPKGGMKATEPSGENEKGSPDDE